MRNTAEAEDLAYDLSLRVAAGGAEVVDRFLHTPSEMARPNWTANLAVQVYRAMRAAELAELRAHGQTATSAPPQSMRTPDPVL